MTHVKLCKNEGRSWIDRHYQMTCCNHRRNQLLRRLRQRLLVLRWSPHVYTSSNRSRRQLRQRSPRVYAALNTHCRIVSSQAVAVNILQGAAEQHVMSGVTVERKSQRTLYDATDLASNGSIRRTQLWQHLPHTCVKMIVSTTANIGPTIIIIIIIIIISGFGIYGAAVVPDSGVGNTWQRLTLVLYEFLSNQPSQINQRTTVPLDVKQTHM